MSTPQMSSASARLFPPILGLILASLAAFSLCVASTSRSTSRQVQVSSAVAMAFDHLGDAFNAQAAITASYILRGSPELRATFVEKHALARKSLKTIAGSAESGDRAAGAAADTAHSEYATHLRRAIAMAQADPARAALVLRRAQGDVRDLQKQIHERAHARHDEHVGAMASVAQRQDELFFAMLLIVPAGLLLLVIFTVAFRRGERRAQEQRVAALEKAALTDSLTGLRNHRAFQEDLTACISALGQNDRLSVVLLDLDELKTINDRDGHAAGDAALKAAAAALQAAEGNPYRVGGDEFALVMPGFAPHDALSTLAALLRRSGARMSAGMTGWQPGLERDAVVRHADLALLEAKRSRRGLVVYSVDLDPVLIESQVCSRMPRRSDITLASALARAVDARDPLTRSHSEVVAELCSLMAQQLGLDQAHTARVRLAGLLHDVGKIGVPDELLRRAGPLTHDEYELMKTHAELGAGIVAAADLPEEAGWIRHHHERLDGRGYPAGLADPDIPLESRIIHVADAYEAMMAGRPYRQARSRDEALAELSRAAGDQFDPVCVEALSAVVDGVSVPQAAEGAPVVAR